MREHLKIQKVYKYLHGWKTRNDNTMIMSKVVIAAYKDDAATGQGYYVSYSRAPEVPVTSPRSLTFCLSVHPVIFSYL